MLRRTVRFYHLIQLYRRIELIGRSRVPQVHTYRQEHDDRARHQTAHADEDQHHQVQPEDGRHVLVRCRTQRPDGFVRPVRTVTHAVAHQILGYAKLRLRTPKVGTVDLGILDRGYNHFETVRFRAPVIGHVLECEKVRLGEQRSH